MATSNQQQEQKCAANAVSAPKDPDEQSPPPNANSDPFSGRSFHPLMFSAYPTNEAQPSHQQQHSQPMMNNGMGSTSNSIGQSLGRNNTLGHTSLVSPFVSTGYNNSSLGSLSMNTTAMNSQMGSSAAMGGGSYVNPYAAVGDSSNRTNNAAVRNNNGMESARNHIPIDLGGRGNRMESSSLNTAIAAPTNGASVKRTGTPIPKRLEKARFRRFVQVLMKHLEKKDPALRQQVGNTIRSYRSQGYADLEQRLKRQVGEQHWKVAEGYLKTILIKLAAQRNVEKAAPLNNSLPTINNTDANDTTKPGRTMAPPAKRQQPQNRHCTE